MANTITPAHLLSVNLTGAKILSQNSTIYITVCAVWVGIPPLIVFLSTILAIINLRKQNQMSDSQENCRNASKTIIYFAIVFLICYFPTFLNAAFLTITDFSSRGYVYFYKNTFLFFYSWQISDIFCFVLNSALNPILYICRFKEMRKWLKELFCIIACKRAKFTGSLQVIV